MSGLNRSDITFLVELGKRFFISAIQTLNVWGIQGVFLKLKKKQLNSTANIWAGATDCCFDTRLVVRQQVFLHLLLSYRGNRRQAFILDAESSQEKYINGGTGLSTLMTPESKNK